MGSVGWGLWDGVCRVGSVGWGLWGEVCGMRSVGWGLSEGFCGGGCIEVYEVVVRDIYGRRVL